MIINITQHCTLRCPHCMQNAGPERKEFMNIDVFSKALTFAKYIKSKSVSLSGGEPTSHQMFFQYLNLALQYFPIVSVLSNGTFIRDHAFTEKFADMVSNRDGFYLQISSFKGLYSNYDEIHKPHLKALRLFGNRVTLCDNDKEIFMKPLGRASSGVWYEEAKRVNHFPSCINSALLIAQMKDYIDHDSIGIGEFFENHNRFCVPIVSWDGSIRLGESEQCKVVSNVSEPLDDINKKMLAFRPCGGCDSYNWHLKNPLTEQEKKVCSILWSTNNQNSDGTKEE